MADVDDGLTVIVEDVGSGRCLVTVKFGSGSWSRPFDLVTGDYGALTRAFEEQMNSEPRGGSDLEPLIMAGVLEMAITREIGRTAAKMAADRRVGAVGREKK